MDRRRMIYKNMRTQIMTEENAQREKQYVDKMSAMEIKVRQREQERRQQDQLLAQEAAEAERKRKEAIDKNKNFLDNLEAFNVE